MRLSVVIPAYNEAKKIEEDLRAAGRFLAEQPFESEVLVVDDGSSDDTAQIARGVAEKLSYPNVRFSVLQYGANRGKGFAVKFGVLQAKGEVIAFVDSGLCVPLKYLTTGINAIAKGHQVAIASRRLAETRIIRPQPLYRRWGSKVFWLIVQSVMGVRVTDTQCGFKLYQRDAARAIYSRINTAGFMFDIEALILAGKLGYSVTEFGVEWANDSDSRYDPLWGTLRNFRELLAIRLRSHA